MRTWAGRGIGGLMVALAACAGEGAEAGRDLETRVAVASFATDGCRLAPAELDGATVWVDARGLWLAPHESAASSAPTLVVPLAEGEGAHDPVIAAADGGESLILVAVDRAAGTELRAYDRLGATRWTATAEEQRSLAPMVMPSRILWPILTPEGVRYSWRDDASGVEVASFATDRAPRAPMVALDGRLEGGGTHWIVGTDGGVELLRDSLASSRLEDLPATPRTPGIVARWSSEAPVLAMTGIGDDVAVVLGPVGSERLQLLRVEVSGTPTIVPTAAPIALPGDVHADPVAFACDERNAARWFCGAGASGSVALAGDGWMGAWSLPDGRELARRTLAMDVMTMTLGASGRIAGGGTHWLPSGELGWRLALLDPTASSEDIELAEGEGGCVTSPLWDTDGAIAAVVSGPEPMLVRGVARVPEGALGIAAGRPRSRGGRRNTTERVAGGFVCDDGVARGGGAVMLGDDFIEGIVVSGTSVVAYGSRDERGLLRWLPEIGAEVALRVEDTRHVERAVGLGNGSVAVVYRDLAERVHVRAFSATGSLWDWDLVEDGGSLVALIQTANGEIWLGQRSGSADFVHRVDPATGPIETRAFFEDDGIGLSLLVADPRGGALMVLDGTPRIGLRRLDEGGAPGAILWWGEGDGNRVATAAAVDTERAIRVVSEQVGGAVTLLIGRGDALEEVPLPIVAENAAFTLAGDGLAISSAGFLRVSGTGRVGLLRAPPDDWQPLIPGRSLVATGDGFVAAFTRVGAEGSELVWGWADGHGFFACASVGACAAVAPATCDATEACAPRGCAPDTGACADGEALSCGP